MDFEDLLTSYLTTTATTLSTEQLLWSKLFDHYQLPALTDTIVSVDHGKELFEDAYYAKTQKDTVMKDLQECDVIIDVVKNVSFSKFLIILGNQKINTDINSTWLENCDKMNEQFKTVDIKDILTKEILIENNEDFFTLKLTNTWKTESHDILVNLTTSQLEGFLYQAYSCYLLKEL